MAYKCITEGMDKLIQKMDQLGEAGRGAAAAGLFEAAGVYANEVSRGAQGIATEPFKFAKGGHKRKPSPEEKAIILSQGSFGIAKFRKNGQSVNTSIGYEGSGYAKVNWKHMKNTERTNYKLMDGKATWSGKAYLKRGEDGHAVRDRGKGGAQNAKPIEMIANAINSGTSFMEKQPYVRKAISRAKGKAESAFEAKTTEVLDKIAKE